MTKTEIEPLAPGVYFGLDEDLYHADPALGSTDIKRLIKGGVSSFWWYSKFNPMRPTDTSTPDKEAGKAIHKIVLEGAPAFDAIYMRRPDDPDGATSAEKSATTKQFNKRAAAEGRVLLKGDIYDRAIIAGGAIASEPELATAFSNGMSEVSIITERHGVRVKCRIDYLKIRGLGDLKSVTNERERAFEAACRYQMSDYRMPLQAVQYMDLRLDLAKFIDDGAVFGDCDLAWLRKVALQREFGWQWVFYQKTQAPIVWSATLSPLNPICAFEREQIAMALDRYKKSLATYGAEGTPWRQTVKPEEITLDDLPSHYGMR